jgi:tyrosyl-tRNA synthetase
MTLIEELRWRGMIQDMMPGTEELLAKEMVSGYIGFDPTSDSLHIGSLVPILLLVHLQNAGHKPYALVGGATGMVGDPSGKSEERNLLSEDILLHNQEGVRKQLEKFLDFDAAKKNAAVMVNNYDWFKEINFLSFIRDAGKHITVNYMMAKDSVKKRLEGDTGMSFTDLFRATIFTGCTKTKIVNFKWVVVISGAISPQVQNLLDVKQAVKLLHLPVHLSKKQTAESLVKPKKETFG